MQLIDRCYIQNNSYPGVPAHQKLEYKDSNQNFSLAESLLRSLCVFSVLNTRPQCTVRQFSLLCSYYLSRNTLYLQLRCICGLRCGGFGVHMLWVLLNHPDFTSPAGVSWKSCQILGEHISSACYKVWHQMYSRTMVRATNQPGFKGSSPAH